MPIEKADKMAHIDNTDKMFGLNINYWKVKY